MLIRTLSPRFSPFYRATWRQYCSSSSASYDHEVIGKLAGRSLLRIDDFSPQELINVLKLSAHIKKLVKSGELPKVLDGKSIACIFQKRSTRTRVSTETGMGLLGGQSLFLSSDDMQLGVNETVKDSALVLSRFNSILLARVNEHSTVEALAEHATAPVINALSELFHPLQSLADYMTMQEHFGTTNLTGKTLTWVGDGNNVLHDLMLAAPPLGVNVRVCTPDGFMPHDDVICKTNMIAAKHGTSLKFIPNAVEAVTGSDVITTDTWISMGQEEERERRLKAFSGHQVTAELMSHANPGAVFMHCLPRHSEEVTDEVFYSKRSIVFDEAENRMYTVMAVMASMLGARL